MRRNKNPFPSGPIFQPEGVIDTTDEYWTGQILWEYGWPCYIWNGCNVSLNLTDEEWMERFMACPYFSRPSKKTNLSRCTKCKNPPIDPVPPFFDCPHGHYLTPKRLEMQDKAARSYQFVPYAVIWVVTLVTPGAFLLDFVVTFAWLINLWIYFSDKKMRRKMHRYLSGAGPWAENPSYYWERNTWWNHPWDGNPLANLLS